MSFLYPLGLLGLIGVPILIIIYIIKNKYTEQVIASTYLWALSEKFLKKRLPINKLVGIISLILQIITVILVSFALAHPVLIRKGAADDFCFVIDGSGSMNFVQDDKTRLDLAKERVSEIIDDSANGSAYTLVFVGSTTNEIYSGITDREQALSLLGGISPSYAATGFTDAIGAAQSYFNANPAVKTYLVTDKDFKSSDNVNVINVGAEVENYAVSDVKYEIGDSLRVSGSVMSYKSDASLNVSLYLDGLPAAAATKTVEVKGLQVAEFTLESTQVEFGSLRVEISNADALAADNEITVYNVDYENSYTALLVSETPFYMQAVLKAVGNARTTVIKPEDYTGGDGYDLCIFDSFTPETIPQNSAVWFFNPESVAGAGFSVQNDITLTSAARAKYSSSTSTVVRSLLNNVIKEDFYVIKYKKCGLYRNFTTLVSVGDDPLVFTGTNDYGNRTVVFAFALKDTNFPPLQDYRVLSGNLLSFAFPTVIDKSSYYCGEMLQVNVVANCDGIRVVSPSGGISYLDVSGAVSEFELTEVGTYTLTVLYGDNSRIYNVYAAFPEDERFPVTEGEAFSLQGEAGGSRRDGIFDNLFILVIILAVVFAADWVVYCYEQYQLR